MFSPGMLWSLPQTPILDKGSLYLYSLLWNRQLRGEAYFSTQPSGCPSDTHLFSFCGQEMWDHSAFHPPSCTSASLAFWRGSHCMVHGQDISSNIIPGAAQWHRLYSAWHCFWKGSSVNEQLSVFHVDSSFYMQQQRAVVVGIHYFRFLLANGTSPNSLYLQKLLRIYLLTADIFQWFTYPKTLL